MSRNLGNNIEPIWNPRCSDPKLQMAKLLNWYNYHKGHNTAIQYTINYLKTTSIDKVTINKIKSLPKSEFPYTMGWLARIVTQTDEELPEGVQEKLDAYVESLKNRAQELKSETVDITPKVNIQEAIQQKIDDVIVELETMIDDYIQNDCRGNKNIRAFLELNNVKTNQCNPIKTHFLRLIEEYSSIMNSEEVDIKEAYSHFNKPMFKRLIKFLELITEELQNWEEDSKRIRASKRKRKPKSPLKQVARLKYLKKDDEFKLESIPPTRIVGAQELWVYNTKYKTLGVYKCPNGHGFSVKGSTIQNFDLTSSVSKRLRKPKEVLESVMSGKKKDLKRVLANLSTREKKLTGRINDNTILLKVM